MQSHFFVLQSVINYLGEQKESHSLYQIFLNVKLQVQYKFFINWKCFLSLDDELRKKYDVYGEEGLKDNHFSNQYQSWSYYNEQFGIYDDDPEIITLSQSDFGKKFLVCKL